MDWVLKVLKAAGQVVDTLVPMGVGSRTKFAVVACPVLGVIGPVVASLHPAAAVALPIVQHALCAAAPAFALAGVVRDK